MTRVHMMEDFETGIRKTFDGSLAALVLASICIVVFGALIQVSFGAYSTTLAQAWNAVFDPKVVTNPEVLSALLFGNELPRNVSLSDETTIIWSIRLPRIFVAVLVGANLAISGAIFQAVTRNELASPYILGVSHGAGLAVLLTLIVFSGLSLFLPVFAALGGIAAFLVVYAIAWKGGTSPIRLVLAGFIVGTICYSFQRGLFFFAQDIGVVQTALAWTTGSLTGVGWEQVRIILVPTLFVVPVGLLASRQLNLLLLGERTARSLGMSVERVRFALSALAILAASAAISVAGIVSFVGLIVPHIVRNVVGTDYRKVVLGCLFVGPALVVGADVGARLALNPVQVPVGIVTGLVGGPYFLYLMRKRKKLGEL
jgi:iron complex transport system permease protein